MMNCFLRNWITNLIILDNLVLVFQKIMVCFSWIVGFVSILFFKGLPGLMVIKNVGLILCVSEGG
jgi:hypothetical protein